jgi:hypothetical protein
MENGLWEKSTFLASSSHSYIGKSTIQQSSKRSSSTGSVPRRPRARASPAKLANFRIAGGEEAGIAIFQTQLGADGLGALRTDVLGNGAGAFQIAAFLAPEDIAQTRLAFPCAQEFIRSQNARLPPVLAPGSPRPRPWGSSRSCRQRP